MSQEQDQYIAGDSEEAKYDKKEWQLSELIRSCQGIITQEECIHKVCMDSSNNKYVYVVPEAFYKEAVRRNHQIIAMLEEQEKV